jgi:hypothetical protein
MGVLRIKGNDILAAPVPKTDNKRPFGIPILDKIFEDPLKPGDVWLNLRRIEIHFSDSLLEEPLKPADFWLDVHRSLADDHYDPSKGLISNLVTKASWRLETVGDMIRFYDALVEYIRREGNEYQRDNAEKLITRKILEQITGENTFDIDSNLVRYDMEKRANWHTALNNVGRSKYSSTGIEITIRE